MSFVRHQSKYFQRKAKSFLKQVLKVQKITFIHSATRKQVDIHSI